MVAVKKKPLHVPRFLFVQGLVSFRKGVSLATLSVSYGLMVTCAGFDRALRWDHQRAPLYSFYSCQVKFEPCTWLKLVLALDPVDKHWVHRNIASRLFLIFHSNFHVKCRV